MVRRQRGRGQYRAPCAHVSSTTAVRRGRIDAVLLQPGIELGVTEQPSFARRLFGPPPPVPSATTAGIKPAKAGGARVLA